MDATLEAPRCVQEPQSKPSLEQLSGLFSVKGSIESPYLLVLGKCNYYGIRRFSPIVLAGGSAYSFGGIARPIQGGHRFP
jgi:hypothetical protein